MGKRVAICAVAQIPFETNLWQKRFQQMCFEVVEQIVKQTGVTFDDEKGLKDFVTCSDDVFDARTISNGAVTDAIGAHFKGEEKCAMDGLNAIAYAMALILSGHDDLSLVVGHCKESQTESRNMCTNLAFDPFYCRPVGLDYLNVSAMQARAYMKRAKLTDAHLAKIVVDSRSKAAKNPAALLKEQVTEEQVMNSPMVCDPIREMHCYPVSDGAIAMLLASEKRCREFTDKPVFITGFENCMDSYFPGDRDLGGSLSLVKAAKKAYKTAKVKKPEEAFDVIEINAPYAYQVAMRAEGLGLCAKNKGGAWIDGGGLERVNLSGGMLSGNPIMIGGLARAAEAVIQLRGEAGERQVKGAKRALAHGSTGAAGQHQSVMVLENE